MTDLAQPAIDPRLPAILRANAAMVAPAPSQMAMPSSNPVSTLPPLAMPNVQRIPTQTETDRTKLDSLVSSGAGVDHINNGFVHGLAKTANVFGTAASVLFPALRPILAATPGTTENFNHHVGIMRATLANDQANDLGTAKTADAEAQATQRQALAQQEQAKAQQLEDPQKAGDPSKTVATDDGVYQFNPATSKYDQRVGGTVEKPKSLDQQAYETALPQVGGDPIKALAAVYGAHNQKDASLPQQYLDAKASGDEHKAALIRQVINDTSTQPKIQILNAGAANRASASGSGGMDDPAMEARAQQIANGDVKPPPTGRSNPINQALLKRVYEINPKYSDSLYTSTQDLRSTKPNSMGANVGRLGTAILHGDEALKNSASLGFSPALLTGIGTPGAAAYKESAEFLTGEVGQYVEGGKLTNGQGDALKKDLLSPVQSTRDSAAKEIISLSGGKLKSQMESFKNATQNEFPTDRVFNDPSIKSALQKHGILNGGGGPSAPAEGTPKTNSHGDKIVFRNGAWGPA